MTGFSALPEDDRDQFIRMGIALHVIQIAEGTLGKVISVVFHSADAISLASLEAEEESVRRRTLAS